MTRQNKLRHTLNELRHTICDLRLTLSELRRTHIEVRRIVFWDVPHRMYIELRRIVIEPWFSLVELRLAPRASEDYSRKTSLVIRKKHMDGERK
jgi:hypothetical protein